LNYVLHVERQDCRFTIELQIPNMENCQHCETEIASTDPYCSNCGQSREISMPVIEPDKNIGSTSEKGNATLLLVLCILSLLGSLIGIFRGALYQMIGDNDYFRGWIFIILNIGTIVGAIYLLQKKVLGLYLYSAFQGLYLLSIIWTAAVWLNEMDYEIVLIFALIFFLPSLIFLRVYWSKPVRGNLS
jgi:hypothetical protein